MFPPASDLEVTYPPVPANLQRRRVWSALRYFGPGAIIASVTIGSGETLFASRCGAIFGYSLLWFITLCAIFKGVQVYTSARYMTLTGEHPMEAWMRLPGPRGWFPWMMGVLSVLCFPFWLAALPFFLGSVMNWIVGAENTPATAEHYRYLARVWGTGTIVLAVILTFVQSYRVFEKVQTALVALLLVFVLAGAAYAPVDWPQAIRSTFIIEWPHYEEWLQIEHPQVVKDFTVVAAMTVFMGAIGGGSYDYLGYLGFYREKSWGAIEGNPSSGPALAREALRTGGATAFPAATSPENLRRARRWLSAPLIDVGLGFAAVLIFTIAFNVLGAAILHPQHLVPKGLDLLTPQVRFLTQFGEGFKYLYQVGIVVAIWGTLYGAFEIYTRTAYECFRPLAAAVRTANYRRFRVPVVAYAGIGGLTLMWTIDDPIAIAAPAALTGTVTCGLWCFAMIWTDRTSLPKPLRMNGAMVLLNVVSGAFLAGFGIKAIYDKLAPLLPDSLGG